MELVTGIPAMLKNDSALRCTPSPAAKSWMNENKKTITRANGFKIKN